MIFYESNSERWSSGLNDFIVWSSRCVWDEGNGYENLRVEPTDA